MAKLTEEQQQAIRAWLDEGASLGDVQLRLREEFKLHMTFFDVRMAVMEIGAQVKDQVAQVEADDVTKAKLPVTPTPSAAGPTVAAAQAAEEPQGLVSITVDTLQTPGAIVSGSVVFSDGVKARWYFDNMGRFGFEPSVPGYRPTEADSKNFQSMLQQELSSRGF